MRRIKQVELWLSTHAAPPSPSEQKVDVWGAGIVLYSLLYRQLPYELGRPDIFADHDERRRSPPPGHGVDPGARLG